MMDAFRPMVFRRVFRYLPQSVGCIVLLSIIPDDLQKKNLLQNSFLAGGRFTGLLGSNLLRRIHPDWVPGMIRPGFLIPSPKQSLEQYTLFVQLCSFSFLLSYGSYFRRRLMTHKAEVPINTPIEIQPMLTVERCCEALICLSSIAVGPNVHT